MTLVLKDSRLDPRTIEEQMQKNPPRLLASASGGSSRNIFTGIVRLSWPFLFEIKPARQMKDGSMSRPQWGADLVFPFGADMSVFASVWAEVCREAFPQHWTPDGKPNGLHSPFHDQSEKVYIPKPMLGYVPGAIYFTATANEEYRPAVVDQALQPVTDKTRCYPGVWAFCSINCYAIGKTGASPKKGASFGLNSVMLMYDDVKLAGGGTDVKQDFAGISITAASNVAAKFAGIPQASPPPTPSVMPSGGHVGAPGNLPVIDVNDLM